LFTILAYKFLINRFVSYIVQIKVTTQRQINDALKDTIIFLSILINKIKDWVIILQAIMLFSMCSLIIIFKNSIKLFAIKIFEDILNWAIAKYNFNLIKKSIKHIIFSDIEFKINDKIFIYEIDCFEDNLYTIDLIVTHI
jgi:hypothetical protein